MLRVHIRAAWSDNLSWPSQCTGCEGVGRGDGYAWVIILLKWYDWCQVGYRAGKGIPPLSLPCVLIVMSDKATVRRVAGRSFLIWSARTAHHLTISFIAKDMSGDVAQTTWNRCVHLNHAAILTIVFRLLPVSPVSNLAIIYFKLGFQRLPRMCWRVQTLL